MIDSDNREENFIVIFIVVTFDLVEMKKGLVLIFI